MRLISGLKEGQGNSSIWFFFSYAFAKREYAWDHCLAERRRDAQDADVLKIELNFCREYQRSNAYAYCHGETPDRQKHPQIVIEHPAYFTVGTVHFQSNSSSLLLQTITLPSLPNKLNLDSSLQRTVFQKFSGLANIILANLRFFNRLTLLTYGRFRAARPNSPYSLARRLIVS